MPASWTKKDVQLYALGVGCQPDTELAFVYEQKGPKVLPTYGVIAGMMSMGGMMGKVEMNLANLLHGEQAITLHRPIPPQAKVECIGKITGCGTRARPRCWAWKGWCRTRTVPSARPTRPSS